MTIIVKTVGGLGNQLFHYSFARALAKHLKTDFKLDIAAYRPELHYWPPGFFLPKYELDIFDIKNVTFAKGSDMFGFVWARRHYKLFDKIYARLRSLKKIILPFYFKEKTFAFDPEVFRKKGTIYFDGFWQTEKYFKSIEDEIREEIQPIKPLSEYSQDISKTIRNTNSISIHVRRGDLVTNSVNNAFHGICSLEYYKQAVSYLTKNISEPHFFLFSDDQKWVAENFKWLPGQYTVIENGPDKNYEDLILMSQCQHHIIANSSFSWWGAWLNSDKNKIVIAPKKWFAGAPKNDTSDLLPSDWIRL